MLASIALSTCNLGDEVRVGTNPFTGDKVEFDIDKGMTAEEVAACKVLLAEFHATKSDDDNYFNITFDAETSVEIGMGPLDNSQPVNGIGVNILGPVTIDIVRFIRRLAIDTGMAVGSAFDPDIIGVLRDIVTERMSKRWPNVRVLLSEEEFVDWVRSDLQIEIVD